MKYFTQDLLSGNIDEAEVESIRSSYQQHIDALVNNSHDGIAELARMSLHDGLIRRIVVNHKTGELSLSLRCGDLHVGYFDLDIFYSGVSMDAQLLEVLSRRVNDRQTEIHADEIDTVAEGKFVHRILFWPDDEVAIVFSSLRMTRQARPDRKDSCDEAPYTEIMD